jgi:putative oxidoreductase
MNSSLNYLRSRGHCIVGMIDRWVAPVITLAARLYVARVFFLSGLTKINDWDTTIALFTDEYHVPVLPPALAAFMGAAGELSFPVLLVLGLGGRLGALGLSMVNVMAVVSYYYVLSQNDSLITNHLCWGIILALLFAHGPGKLSLDAWITKRWPSTH